MTTTYSQHQLTLPSLARGSHLVTSHITDALPEIKTVKCGLLHLFLQHTSCGLTMNENWDSDVRKDMSDALDRIVVEDTGRLATGTWQGIWFLEFRNGKQRRKILATIQGEKM
ncbi:uncharacterized protein KY384_005349 [Bacidia gigantensis]|uniref:uncharacterized protein n=1 Tax=Bacidia gigantensis TaxID=2732470 RepID=UPI001D044D8A|nr:uncharacterized protein KY384_005349 [Bacidia gigantensis]KAG8529868.1 hypothetical protein KY384_005349 [Bacidia gigantensis]